MDEDEAFLTAKSDRRRKEQLEANLKHDLSIAMSTVKLGSQEFSSVDYSALISVAEQRKAKLTIIFDYKHGDFGVTYRSGSGKEYRGEHKTIGGAFSACYNEVFFGELSPGDKI